MPHHLVEFNVARLHRPLDAEDNAEFVAALDAINLLAEGSRGFVWRLQDDSGLSASYVVAYEDPLLIINLSVWESVEDLHHYVYKSGHSAYLRRRREWFEPMAAASLICWWIPAGTIPTVAEAIARLDHFRAHGASERAFAFSDPLPPPSN